MEVYRIEDGDLPSSSSTGEAPSLSVVVPVYDDPEGVGRTVRSIAAADYDDYELLVVVTPADGSTRAVLEDCSAAIPELRTLVEDEHRTPGSARNVGVEHASGEGVIFVDADMTVDEDLLPAVAHLLTERSVDYLGYPVEMVAEDGDPSLAARYDARARFPVQFFLEVLSFCPTCCLAVRSEVLESIQFDPAMIAAEDMAFGRRVHEAGFDIGFCPDVTVYHPVRTTARSIWTKGVKTGRGLYQLDEAYPDGYGFQRSRLRMVDSYLPDTGSDLVHVCRGWSSLPLREKLVVGAFAYLEKLGRAWGYLRQSRRGTAGAGGASPSP